MADEHPLPEQDPDLSDVWLALTPEERLAYLLAAAEKPPAGLTEAAQRQLADDQD